MDWITIYNQVKDTLELPITITLKVVWDNELKFAYGFYGRSKSIFLSTILVYNHEHIFIHELVHYSQDLKGQPVCHDEYFQGKYRICMERRNKLTCTPLL